MGSDSLFGLFLVDQRIFDGRNLDEEQSQKKKKENVSVSFTPSSKLYSVEVPDRFVSLQKATFRNFLRLTRFQLSRSSLCTLQNPVNGDVTITALTLQLIRNYRKLRAEDSLRSLN